MTRNSLLHIVFHGNIHDTVCINVDEFHHENTSAKTLRQENYEILSKSLDKTHQNVLKSFQPANFAVERTAMLNRARSESRDRSKTDKFRPEVTQNPHVNNLRKALPALSRRYPVCNQARGTNSQVSAVHQTDRSSSGTRAIDANGTTSSLTDWGNPERSDTRNSFPDEAPVENRGFLVQTKTTNISPENPTTETSNMKQTAIFPRRCPVCQGDVQFGRGLDGITLKCIQCTRIISPAQARQILVEMQRERAAVVKAA